MSQIKKNQSKIQINESSDCIIDSVSIILTSQKLSQFHQSEFCDYKSSQNFIISVSNIQTFPTDTQAINSEQKKKGSLIQSSLCKVNQPLNEKKSQALNIQEVTILLILTSKLRIDDVGVIYGKEKTVISPTLHSFCHKQQNSTIAIFQLPESDIETLFVSFKQITMSLRFFQSSEQTKRLNFANAKFQENVGIMSNNITCMDEMPIIDPELFSHSLLVANQIIVQKDHKLGKKPNKQRKIFYSLFKRFFAEQNQKRIKIIKQFIPINEPLYIQHFLYFLLHIHKSQAITQIFKEQNLQKMRFNNKQLIQFCKSCEHTYFQNKNQIEQIRLFKLQFALRYGVLYLQNDFSIAHTLLQTIILNHSNQKTHQIVKFALFHKIQSFFMQNELINSKLINNPSITLTDYLQLKINYCQIKIKQQNLQHGNINQVIISFISDIIQKSKINKTCNGTLTSFQERIREILLKANNLRIKRQFVGQFYKKIKYLLQAVPNLGKIILNIVSKQVYKILPSLMKQNYKDILNTILIKPQSKQYFIINQYFLKEPISVYIIQQLIATQTKFATSGLYLFQIFVTIFNNPHISKLKMSQLKKIVSKCLENLVVNEKLVILQMFRSMIDKFVKQQQKQDILEWCRSKNKQIGL